MRNDLPVQMNNIKILGEAGTVTILSKINAKLADKGIHAYSLVM